MIIKSCEEAYEAESKIIDWIYEAGELDFMPSSNVKEFVKIASIIPWLQLACHASLK